jgi:hypothetical protein
MTNENTQNTAFIRVILPCYNEEVSMCIGVPLSLSLNITEKGIIWITNTNI